jgi:glycosyltransferase involved in cell wall biosynthesis
MSQEASRPAPALSIGLPVYNGERYLEAALRSLAAQTFDDYELIICDNASTDRTSEICADYAARDPRVRHVRHPANIGMLPNFDRAAELARADLFMWAASDDLWHPRFAERLVGALRANPGAGLAYCDYDWVDDDERPVARGKVRFAARRPSALDRLLTFDPRNRPAYNFLLYFAWRNPFLVYGVFRTKALRRVLPFQFLFKDARHVDNVLMLRFLARERAVVVDELLFHYRAKNRVTDETREAYRAPGADASGEGSGEADVEAMLVRRALEIVGDGSFGPLEARLLPPALYAVGAMRRARERVGQLRASPR